MLSLSQDILLSRAVHLGYTFLLINHKNFKIKL
jgi:hypothetical protein